MCVSVCVCERGREEVREEGRGRRGGQEKAFWDQKHTLLQAKIRPPGPVPTPPHPQLLNLAQTEADLDLGGYSSALKTAVLSSSTRKKQDAESRVN